MLLISSIAGCLLFPRLSYALVEPDEGRYAEIGREMLRSGDWIVPHMNGLPYFDKPPLLYWLTAASLRVFGLHAWAARMVPALCAFLTVLGTFWFVARIFGARAGFLAGLALSLMVGFLQCGRFLIIDGLLTLTVAGGLFAAYEAIRTDRLRRNWWVLSAVFCALAVLAKGPIGVVLIVFPMVGFVWLDRDASRPSLRHWLGYAAVALAVSLPWYVTMSVREPAFVREFIVEHHLLRFVGPDFHAAPWWFYFPVALVGCLPWTFLLWPVLRFLLTHSSEVTALRPRALGFFVLSGAWCFLFFTLSRGKLPTYILPAAPALAVVLGWYLDVMLFRMAHAPAFHRIRRMGPLLIFSFVAITCVVGAIASVSMDWLPPGRRIWMFGGAAVCLLAFALHLMRRLPSVPAWALSAVVAFGFLAELSQDIVPLWANQRSPVASARDLFKDSDTAVVCDGLGEDWGSVPFTLDRDDAFFQAKTHKKNEIRRFIENRDRVLMFVKPEAQVERNRGWIPDNHMIHQLIPSGKALIFDLRPLASPSPSDLSLRAPRPIR